MDVDGRKHGWEWAALWALEKGEQCSASMLFGPTALDRVLPRKVSDEHGRFQNFDRVRWELE